VLNNAISLTAIGKTYRVYEKPTNRLKQNLFPKAFSLLGKSPKRYFSEVVALENVSLQVLKGQAVGILGANGAGKSTLLQIICGTLAPTTGSINLSGQATGLLELGSGFNGDYSGRENIHLNGQLLGLNSAQIEALLPEIEAFAELGEFIDQPIKIYSTGMVMRLAFSVIINTNPEILIIDEALAVGDFYFQQKCFKKLEELKKSGTTLLFVSHDVGSILNLCDSAILLKNGAIDFFGSPKEAVARFHASLQNSGSLEAEKKEPIGSLSGKLLKENYFQNREANIYGSGKVDITDWAICSVDGKPISVVQSDEEIKVYIKATFREDCVAPIFGYFFTDVFGQQIGGTNTMFINADIGPRKKGDIIEIEFNQTLNFSSGKYSLNLGCSEYIDGGLVAHHRLYEITAIDFFSINKSVGFVSPKTTITLRGSVS